MSVSVDIYYKFVVRQNFVVELSTTKWIYYNFVVVLQFCSTVRSVLRNCSSSKSTTKFVDRTGPWACPLKTSLLLCRSSLDDHGTLVHYTIAYPFSLTTPRRYPSPLPYSRRLSSSCDAEIILADTIVLLVSLATIKPYMYVSMSNS